MYGIEHEQDEDDYEDLYGIVRGPPKPPPIGPPKPPTPDPDLVDTPYADKRMRKARDQNVNEVRDYLSAFDPEGDGYQDTRVAQRIVGAKQGWPKTRRQFTEDYKQRAVQAGMDPLKAEEQAYKMANRAEEVGHLPPPGEDWDEVRARAAQDALFMHDE